MDEKIEMLESILEDDEKYIEFLKKNTTGYCSTCRKKIKNFSKAVPCPLSFRATEIVTEYTSTSGAVYTIKDKISSRKKHPNIYREAAYYCTKEIFCSNECIKICKGPLYEDTEMLLKRIVRMRYKIIFK